MLKIAHRGNISGPKPELENSPEYLLKAIIAGFDVEVDLWVLDGKLSLGHDEPTYDVELHFIDFISDRAWFHCKNLAALRHMIDTRSWYKFFWHQKDDFTLTSNGYIWTYPGKETTGSSIVVDLGINPQTSGIYGVCADYLV